MKPANDMTDLPLDDWLEHALIEDGRARRADYIVDDGFSARVAAALPPPATLPAWRKPVIAILWAAAAGGVAVVLPGAFIDTTREVLRIVSGMPISLGGITTGVILLGGATWTAAAVAMRKT